MEFADCVLGSLPTKESFPELLKRAGKYMVNDPIADLLIQIKNGYMAHLKKVSIPYSFIKEKIAGILAHEGFISSFDVREENKNKQIHIVLSYKEKDAAITDVVRVSKPGRRVYESFTKLKPVLGGRGILVLSTSKGIMTNKQAKKQKIGGEVLCKIW